MEIYGNDIKHNQSVVYKILATLVCKVFVLHNDCFILISSTHIPHSGSVCIKIGRFNCWGHWSTFRIVPLEKSQKHHEGTINSYSEKPSAYLSRIKF